MYTSYIEEKNVNNMQAPLCVAVCACLLKPHDKNKQKSIDGTVQYYSKCNT